MARPWIAPLVLWACTPSAHHRESLSPAAPPPAASAPPPAASAPPPSGSPGPRSCGELGCLMFDSPEAAFDHVLARPVRVLGVGEAHALKGAAVASSTQRFGEQLLPRLAGRASDLVIELWVAAGNCGPVERDVAERQRDVSVKQSENNQGEFVELGHRAKALGIRPHALTPTCDEYRAIAGAGPGDIDRMLAMIAEGTTRQLEHLLAPGSARLVIAYGGALHNDLAPRPGREHWSFGPALAARTQGEYVELDLIVPEFVKDTESWRAFPWYAAYRALGDVDGTLLYATGTNSFVLIFPRSEMGPSSDDE